MYETICGLWGQMTGSNEKAREQKTMRVIKVLLDAAHRITVLEKELKCVKQAVEDHRDIQYYRRTPEDVTLWRSILEYKCEGVTRE